MTALRCDSQEAREKAAVEVKKAEEALKRAEAEGDDQQIRQAEARLEAAQNNLKAIESGKDIYCLLMTDAKGNVSITTDISPWLPDDLGDEVFKRNPDNSQDSFFANEDGEAAGVNKSNFLRIGTTEYREAAKDDAAMVVAGSIESRGGNFIRKVDGQNSNE
ncbi:hypothetical protein [Chryseobacterium limigenitum]|nr:hypothetical protein [Chryseobacterium limigenitum]